MSAFCNLKTPCKLVVCDLKKRPQETQIKQALSFCLSRIRISCRPGMELGKRAKKLHRSPSCSLRYIRNQRSDTSKWDCHNSAGERAEQQNESERVEFRREKSCENSVRLQNERVSRGRKQNDLGVRSGWIENKLFGITLHVEEWKAAAKIGFRLS